MESKTREKEMDNRIKTKSEIQICKHLERPGMRERNPD